MGHPDKLADQISDGILDALLAQDTSSRVACETLVTTGLAMVAGEITTKAIVNYSEVIRQVIRDVGYVDDQMGINADTCSVMVCIDKQSPDIALGVDADEDTGKEKIVTVNIAWRVNVEIGRLRPDGLRVIKSGLVGNELILIEGMNRVRDGIEIETMLRQVPNPADAAKKKVLK